MLAVSLDESGPQNFHNAIEGRDPKVFIVCGLIVDLKDLDKRTLLLDDIREYLAIKGVKYLEELKHA